MDPRSRSRIYNLLGKILSAWVLFVSISAISEAGFIVFFVNHSFAETIQPVLAELPGLQAFTSILSKIVSPMVNNVTSTLYIWTFTSMIISCEILFAPLLTPRKQIVMY